MNLRPLTDDVLLARLDALVASERSCAADVVEHLAEVDRRELAIDRGYGTLFEYCRKKLGYSESASFLRIRAARAANQFPRVLDDLRSGSIHLDAIMRLYPHLNSENCERVLTRASGASKNEVLALVAQIAPAAPPVERDVVRHLPRAPSIDPPAVIPEAPAVEPTSGIVTPPSRIRMAFTADDEFAVLLERAKNLSRHKFPDGRMEDVLKEAILALLDRIDPDRSGSRKAPSMPALKRRVRSRRIPAAVKSEVWKRDGGRCAYQADGRRCESRGALEYDHIVPWALGGRSDLANIRLLCRPHNQRLARRRFGPRRRP